jgi:hypothetical protein
MCAVMHKESFNGDLCNSLTFRANLLKSLCLRHNPNVTMLWLPTETTTRNSACISPSLLRTIRKRGICKMTGVFSVDGVNWMVDNRYCFGAEIHLYPHSHQEFILSHLSHEYKQNHSFQLKMRVFSLMQVRYHIQR